MKKMSDLPNDLAEEVLSKVPLTSLRKVRLTCKNWNTLSKGPSFAKKHLVGQAKIAAKEREFMMAIMMDFRVYLMRVNLHNDVESCIKREGELVSLDDGKVNVSQVFHCDGLLLCIMKDNTRVMVWNPFGGQPWWVVPTHNSHKLFSYTYALGYEKSSKSCRSYKILRFIDFAPTYVEYKIYDINSDSWRVLKVNPHWKKIYALNSRGVSVKGNTYWFYRNRQRRYLVGFDFTRESFGQPLPLPFEFDTLYTASLSSVREEQLAVLFQCPNTYQMEIWLTTKIEPDLVSWNSKVFLSVNIRRLTYYDFQFHVRAASFFIDEENKVAVVFDKDKDGLMNPTRNVAYIVGVDGSLKEADLGVSAVKNCYPLVCSYVPSLVQL